MTDVSSTGSSTSSSMTLLWKDALHEYGPHKIFYNRFIRWSRSGIFNKVLLNLLSKTALQHDWWLMPLTSKRTEGGLKSKLHAVCNASGQPIVFHLTDCQVSDYRGAAVSLDSLPKPRSCWGTGAIVLIGFAMPDSTMGSLRAFWAGVAGKNQSRMRKSFISNDTRLKSCLADSRRAQNCHTLWSEYSHLLLHYLYRSHCHFLQLTSPEPR